MTAYTHAQAWKLVVWKKINDNISMQCIHVCKASCSHAQNILPAANIYRRGCM